MSEFIKNSKLYGGPIGFFILTILADRFKEELGGVDWLPAFFLTIAGFWTFLAVLSRIPGSYKWLPFGAVEAVPLVLVARKEKDSLADVVPLLQVSIEEHLLSKTNPRLVIHFNGHNGAVFPIKLSSSVAVGNIATPPSEVFPSKVDVRFTDADVIGRGGVFVLELSVAITDDSAKMLKSNNVESGYINLHFHQVKVSVSTVGGLDDSVKHQLVISDSIQISKDRPTDLWQDKFHPPYEL